MNDSSPDFSTLSDGHESKYNMGNIDDTIFSSMKKKTLNDYDKELKSLKEENFNLKLRIYLLEEESGELNSKLKENKCMRRHASSIRLNSFSDEDDANCMDRRFSTSLSDMESTLINDDINNSKIKQRKKIDKKKLLNYYSSDDDQREIEIETLNNINLQLEEKIELLQNQLVEKEKHIEANRKENENLQENFEQFKLDCEREVFENLSEKFQKDLNDKLDDAYQKLYLKEQVFKAEIEKLQSALNEKSNEIELLKQKNNESLRNYKNTAVQQIESLMEQLIQKDNRIKEANNLKSLCDTNEIYSNESEKNNVKSINEEIKHKDSVESIKTHYQFIVSDLENQLQLKENLLQKYILIVKDKDNQLNQLINVSLLCNKDLSQQKLELFINDLRRNLSDKDELYEQTIRNHFELVKQKEDLIINLRASQKQLYSDLNKANEILLESESNVEILNNELHLIQSKNNNLLKLLEFESKKTKDLMGDHQIELNERDEVIQKLRNTESSLRERLKKKTEKTELTYFYEQQLEEKDFLISELNEKISKLTEKISESTNDSSNQQLEKSKSTDEKLNGLIKENNQLRNDLNRVNLELEKLESNFTMQVDEYEIEIENITNKLKDKENTIRNLIISAEEKDDLITKLKSKIISDNNKDCDIAVSEINQSLPLDNSRDTKESSDLNLQKLNDLMKLLDEKNEQIESLKSELNDFKSCKNESTPDLLNTSFPNNKCLMSSSSTSFSNSNNFKYVMDLLEKEVQMYQKLNSNEDRNVKEFLTEISSLRNQLLKMTILRENRILSSVSRMSSSTDNLTVEIENTKTSTKNSDSSKNKLEQDSLPDSGLYSQKSDTTIDSNTDSISPGSSTNKLAKAILVPKLVKSPSLSSLNSSKVSEFTLKNYSRDELINLIQQINNENSILKRQLDNKGPKVTEIHKEVSNLREKLSSSEGINEYLRKQLELHHITHGNAESLFEMAQKLNLTKEELEQYKLRLSKVKSDPGKSRSNVSNLANSLSSKLSEIYSNQDNQENIPTRNIKVTVATLEKELEELKMKYHRLQDRYSNSERLARLLAIKYSKYTPFLNDLGLVKKNNLKRSLSDPNLAIPNQNESISDNQINKLVSKCLADLKSQTKNSTEINKNDTNLIEDQKIDFVNQFKNENLKLKLNEKDMLINEYFDKLSYIYNGFKNLKAQSKYLKQIFGEELMKKLNLNVEQDDAGSNLVHNIFSNAFSKFEELTEQLERKNEQIEKLNKELEDLKSKKNSEDALLDSLDAKISKNDAINLDLKLKVNKYKEENLKLKEKIKIQNKEIEEVVQQLMIYNREKENTKILLNGVKKDDFKKGKQQKPINDGSMLSDKLTKTHLNLKKARDNFQNKIENGVEKLFD